MGVISRSLNPNRSFAVDVFRGLMIAGMILVNNPGGPQTYAPLLHAEWNGWTPTDLVFPSFAFILGLSAMYSFANRRAKTEWAGLSLFDYLVPIMTALLYAVKIAVQTGGFKHGLEPALSAWDLLFPAILIISIALPQMERRACAKGGSLYLQALHHGFLIFAVGFTWSFDPTNPGGYRILGVLHRLGIVYIFASLIVLNTKRRGQIGFVVGLLAFYWIVMKYVSVPGCGAGHLTLDCNMAGYLDNLIMKGHLYRPNWDPEGLFHTIPAIATGLLGCLAGGWLREEKPIGERIAGLFVAGNLLLVAGLILDTWFPINKNLWSPTYVLFAAGFDMIVLGVCVWFIDHRGAKKPFMPFVALGSNSILIYLLSGLVMHYVGMIPAGTHAGEAINVKQVVYYGAFESWLNPYNASLGMALSYVALWMLIGEFFYRKRIFVKM